MLYWMTWKEFRQYLRGLGMSKSMSGAAISGIIDGVPFELYLNGKLLGWWIAEGWLVRGF